MAPYIVFGLVQVDLAGPFEAGLQNSGCLDAASTDRLAALAFPHLQVQDADYDYITQSRNLGLSKLATNVVDKMIVPCLAFKMIDLIPLKSCVKKREKKCSGRVGSCSSPL